MIVKLAAAVALTASIGSAAYAGPVNLVTNGDFNSSAYTVNHQFGSGSSVPTSQGGAQGVDGWTGNGGYDLFFTSTGSSTTQSAVSQYPGGQEDLWWGGAAPAGGSVVGKDGDPPSPSPPVVCRWGGGPRPTRPAAASSPSTVTRVPVRRARSRRPSTA